MMKRLYIIVLIAAVGMLSYSFYGGHDDPATNPVYVGTQGCVCHANIIMTWQNTLHGKAQMYPGPNSVVIPWSGTISMGAAYGNASITLNIVSGQYQATLNPSSGSPVTYTVAQTRGSAWEQFYHVKINNAYYRLPILWKMGSYKNPVGGSLNASSQGSWFNTNGTLKPIDNTFRKTSWDKGCSGCHTTGGKVSLVVTGPDSNWVNNWANGSDTTNAKVGCESCHGPGSDHVSAPSTSNIYGPTQMNAGGVTRQQEVCAQCHFRGTSTNLTYSWPLKESVDSMYHPGLNLQDYVKTPWQNYINVAGGPSLWPDSMSSRNDRSQSQEMTHSAHNTFLNCYSCHDPHQVTSIDHQLRAQVTDNSLCLQCHGNFGSPGSPNIPAITAHTRHSYDPTDQNQTGGSSRCITCHMTNTATVDNNYDIPSHTFKVVRPIQTLLKRGIVLGSNSGNLNSCAAGCHRNPSSAGGTGNVPALGVGIDSNITNWSERTDSLLADTLNRWFNRQTWTIVGIRPISNEVPSKYTLGQNYPNPFNPSTKINFSLPKSEFVSVKIYDITGREVYKLVDEKLNAGTYSVNWNSINNFGDYVSSGVYFYRIEAGNFIESKKMILVK